MFKRSNDAFSFCVEGEKVIIELSKTASRRCGARNIDKYKIYSLVVKMGEKLLNFKNGEQFAIVDKATEAGIIAEINCFEGDVFVDVITVIYDEYIWISKGLKLLNIDEVYDLVA
jgi:hypothetical protein